MPDIDEFAELAQFHTLGDQSVPAVVRSLPGGKEPELVWRNELGGLTFRLGDQFIKWNPTSSGIDLRRESDRLGWISQRHPAPRAIDYGEDDLQQWLVTTALDGEHAVGDEWRRRTPEAIAAIARGLRELHSVPITGFPASWIEGSWANKRPPELGPAPDIGNPVVVHGDACAPNTLISSAGEWTGNVDFGDLTIGDRWADLAVASMSLGWNFGDGHEHAFFAEYGIDPDPERIAYYRALWDMES